MKHSLLLYSLTLAAALAAGCSSMPADPAKMSPEQLREFVKDKNATISCGLANNPYGRIVATYVNLDKAVLVSGVVSVSNECVVTIQADPKPVAVTVTPTK